MITSAADSFLEDACPTLEEQAALEEKVLRFYEQLVAVPPTQRRKHLTLQVPTKMEASPLHPNMTAALKDGLMTFFTN